MRSWIYILVVVLLVSFAVAGHLLLRWVDRRHAERLRELQNKLNPVTAKTTVYPARGGCGVVGCPNRRPHSHVADLVRRIKEK